MSRKQKLLARFLQVPPVKDFRWDELVSLMGQLGFALDESGGGSHKHFYRENDPEIVIYVYRPHPGAIMYVSHLKDISAKLRELGVLP